jgi:hypothetical protein
MSTITMAQASALLGYPKPAARRQRVCVECEGELTWGYEYTARHPFGNGYDVLRCEECGAENDRHWVGF